MEIKNEILKDFVKKGGFDTMSITAVRDFMFDILMREKGEAETPQYGKMGRMLGISATKVKNLHDRYLSRKENIEDNLDDMLRNKLQTSKKYKEGNKIWFAVKEKILRDYISDILEETGRFADASFSRDIMVLSSEAYLDLIRHFCNDFDEEIKRLDTKGQMKEIGSVSIAIEKSDESFLLSLGGLIKEGRYSEIPKKLFEGAVRIFENKVGL